MSGNYGRLINDGFPERPKTPRVDRMILSSGLGGEQELMLALTGDYLKQLGPQAEDPSLILSRATQLASSVILAREAVLDGAGSSTIHGDGFTVYCEGMEEE